MGRTNTGSLLAICILEKQKFAIVGGQEQFFLEFFSGERSCTGDRQRNRDGLICRI